MDKLNKEPTMDMMRVEAFRKHYHEKTSKNPDLYRSGDHAVDVILPNDLLEYANAASGHSGFGSGARARGIRRECRNSTQLLAEIFASTESLAKFLDSSEKNAESYIATVRQRHAQRAQPKPAMANDDKRGFWSRYNKDHMAEAIARVGKERVRELYHNATLEDFERETGLVQAEPA
jgi:hypothetical protein